MKNAIERVVKTLQYSDARSATAFLSASERVTATRVFKKDRRNTRETFMVTLGGLNYWQRQFVMACKKAKEPLPLKRVILKLWPKKK